MTASLLAQPGTRLTRSDLERGVGLVARVGEVARFGFAPKLRLAAVAPPRFPAKLLAAPRDPLAGSAERAQAMLAGRLSYGGASIRLAELSWRNGWPTAELHAFADSFGWARDLASHGNGRATALAAPLLSGWLAANATPGGWAWEPARLGRRVLAFLLHSGLLLAKVELPVRSAFLMHLAHAVRVLERGAERTEPGLDQIRATAAAAALALALPGGDERLARAEAALGEAVALFVAESGAVATRAPVDQLEAIELLVSVGAVYGARGRALPRLVAARLAACAVALRGVVLPDGRLAALSGVAFSGVRLTSALAAVAEGAALPEPALQRIDLGPSCLLLDAGPPPEQRFSAGCSASTLGLEFVSGGERILTNVGGQRGVERALASPLALMARGTAAHSTLTVAETASTGLRDDGGLGRGVSEVTARRHETPLGIHVEAVHDGYRRRWGLDHRRALTLSRDGFELRGEDELVQRQFRMAPPWAARFHLAAGVTAALADGCIRIDTPGGQRWLFTASLAPALEAGMLVSASGLGIAAQQIVLRGAGAGALRWALRRHDRG
ncbi:MAG: heparinase II/III family protein [Sphingomonadaceae bacterium]|nr:heparinase II/III family protein [Sphingomonadaceae bacterium]